MLESYLEWSRHAMFVSLHFLEGIHKFELPVSGTTLKVCGGSPTWISM